MDGHRVTVEVGIEGLADQRVNLNRLAVNENGLEGLHTESVQRGSTVQEHGVLSRHFFQLLPHRHMTVFHHALGTAEGTVPVIGHQGPDNEWLEELQRHDFWQTTLVQFQLRAHHNGGTCGVVDTLTEEVLTEPTLLTLQYVSQ